MTAVTNGAEPHLSALCRDPVDPLARGLCVTPAETNSQRPDFKQSAFRGGVADVSMPELARGISAGLRTPPPKREGERERLCGRKLHRVCRTSAIPTMFRLRVR